MIPFRYTQYERDKEGKIQDVGEMPRWWVGMYVLGGVRCTGVVETCDKKELWKDNSYWGYASGYNLSFSSPLQSLMQALKRKREKKRILKAEGSRETPLRPVS
ncbi:hypothetical protein TWF192_005904 [Orbilia oligospora]|uniref:Uncharacterized protein n=1 Tax=Orbilia oligospora TaxID=2813651 RepID=A0A6G1MMG0_ORBOL|nr:hypothetical protein TWF679_001327 [Orbilia oligospora]KAF3203237.1 hypothetical protein TWF191_002662 [Orbilia oligospora]KAF3263630.1 hypothetical protein TWF192_005904 [Orbilia oligospora]